MTRTDAINHVITAKGYASYLEIGVQAGVNFAAIKCDRKVGVDPDRKSPATVHATSDEYFRTAPAKFDFIFIDGMHTAEQSKKDFENALQHLNEGGCIAFHDTLPHNLQYTSKDWCGDVYRTALGLAESNYKVVTFNWDHGVTFVYYDENALPFWESSKEPYPGLDVLRSKLNAVDSLDELVPEQMTAQVPEALVKKTRKPRTKKE